MTEMQNDLANLMTSNQWLILLSVVAGAIHMLAPDHWVPASVLVWQRRWGSAKTVAFAGIALLVHLLFGFAIYFMISGFLSHLDSDKLFIFALALVLLVALARGIRVERMQEVLRAGPHSAWGLFAVISLLGPCESVIPVFIKARALGMGYLIPFVAFFAGSLLSGTALVLGGRRVWNKPLWLPRGIHWAHQRSAVLPVVAGVAVGLTLLLKLT